MLYESSKWLSPYVIGLRSNLFKQFFFCQASVILETSVKERVHSETKIMDKIKLDPNLVLFPFFFFKSVSFPFDINSGHKISLPGPALSLPGTCIITSEDLHYCFRGPAFSLPGPALLLPDLHYHFWDLHYHFQDLHYFIITFPSRKLKQSEGSKPIQHNH